MNYKEKTKNTPPEISIFRSLSTIGLSVALFISVWKIFDQNFIESLIIINSCDRAIGTLIGQQY